MTDMAIGAVMYFLFHSIIKYFYKYTNKSVIMNKSINKNIRALIEELKITPYEFSKKIGLNRADNLYNIINDKVDASPKMINRIIDAFPEYKEFIYTGEGEMPDSHPSEQTSPSVKHNNPQVPYYNVDFIGGFDIIVNSQAIVPDGYIALPQFGKIDCWVDISGKSMEPLISSGDIIALRQVNDWKNNILYGEVYAIVTAEYRTVKRLRKGSSNDTIKLVPDNPNYDEQEIPAQSILSVYQVMGCTKKMF